MGISKVLLQSATGTGAGDFVVMNEREFIGAKSFQASITGSGALTATVQVEVSNDGSNWVYDSSSTISLSGTGSDSDGCILVVPWNYVRANVTAISGTSAAVTVWMGV